jgi:hypothetical protein
MTERPRVRAALDLLDHHVRHAGDNTDDRDFDFTSYYGRKRDSSPRGAAVRFVGEKRRRRFREMIQKYPGRLRDR